MGDVNSYRIKYLQHASSRKQESSSYIYQHTRSCPSCSLLVGAIIGAVVGTVVGAVETAVGTYPCFERAEAHEPTRRYQPPL